MRFTGFANSVLVINRVFIPEIDSVVVMSSSHVNADQNFNNVDVESIFCIICTAQTAPHVECFDRKDFEVDRKTEIFAKVNYPS